MSKTKAEELREILEVVGDFDHLPFKEININVGGGVVYAPGPGGDPGGDPGGLSQPQRASFFTSTAGGNNKMVPFFKTADPQSTKASMYQGQPQGLLESVPDPGVVGMPKDGTIQERCDKLANALRSWAWVPRQQVQKANGVTYSFPFKSQDENNPVDLQHLSGMWTPRTSFVSQATDQEFINACVAYFRQEISS